MTTAERGAAARRYHEATKHSFRSVREQPHHLDWDNRPHPFKEYLGVEPIPLPVKLPQPEVAALDAIAAPPQPPAALALPDLARLLRFGASVVRTRRFARGDTYHFRSYMSAGALYPVELYVMCAALPGLGAGLYHFHPLERALRPLREGDIRDVLAVAADAPELADAGAVLVLTGIVWRSAWKYRSRAYRHVFWDAGTMLANLLALAASARLGPRLLTGFVDSEVNDLLGIDGEREAALALLAVGRGEHAAPAPPIVPVELEVAPLSPRHPSFPEAQEVHAASSLASATQVRGYRGASDRGGPSGEPPAGAGAGAPPASDETLEAVIRRRGSARDFAPDPVPAEELAALLASALAPIPADVPAQLEVRLIANAVDGLPPGAYRFVAPDRFEPLRHGELRRTAGYLCLEQTLGAHAAATLFLLADLDRTLDELGDRGYRAAQLEAGIRAGRLSLGAYARGLGATGLTFYDDEVTEFLAPGTALAPMLCVAVGVDWRRPALRELWARRRAGGSD